jgi:pyruvate-ferredoxin/flavodoxin oxidoreductase
MSSDHPILGGTSQNPDVYLQAREAANSYYLACPAIKQNSAMDTFAKQTGRQYHLFDYFGAAEAERVLILIGSGAEAAEEAVEYLNVHGEQVGLLKVRLYRPFAIQEFLAALPKTVERIAVLDRTREPGALGSLCTSTWGPHGRRKCHGWLVDLRWQPSDHALCRKS